jgi:hypothetical protein
MSVGDKMKIIFIALISILFFSGSFVFAEESKCEDKVVVLTDATDESENPAQMTVMLDCHSVQGHIPEMTTIQYLSMINGQFCHASRVCGNLENWYGNIRIGGRWYFGETFVNGMMHWDRQDDVNSQNPRWSLGYDRQMHGSNFYIEFKLGFDNIERFCKPMDDWQCMSIPDFGNM